MGEKQDIVVNLSARTLTSLELRVLNKGMGFVPIPKYRPFDIQLDIYKLFRTIKLKKLFGHRHNTREGPYLGPPPSFARTSQTL